MGNRRTAKVAEAIREVVSSSILFELRDPRIGHVTVLGVDVPKDLRSANVRVSVLGDESQQRLTMSGLDAARGYLQSKVADRLALRFAPILSFEIDDSVKKSTEASRILRELSAEREARQRAEQETPHAGSLHESPHTAAESQDTPNTLSESAIAEVDRPGDAVSRRIEDG